jgi:glucose dehydrogenase
MTMKLKCVSLAVVAAVLLDAGTAVGQPAEPAPSEWFLLGRTAEMQHYSPLEQINTTNVNHMGLKWYAEVPTQGGLLGNPLVADGVVY